MSIQAMGSFGQVESTESCFHQCVRPCKEFDQARHTHIAPVEKMSCVSEVDGDRFEVLGEWEVILDFVAFVAVCNAQCDRKV